MILIKNKLTVIVYKMRGAKEVIVYYYTYVQNWSIIEDKLRLHLLRLLNDVCVYSEFMTPIKLNWKLTHAAECETHRHVLKLEININVAIVSISISEMHLMKITENDIIIAFGCVCHNDSTRKFNMN